MPSPTIAWAQRLRASAGVVSVSLAVVQTGRPLVSMLPWPSNMKYSSLRVGGGEPSVSWIRVMLAIVTGALPLAGSARGVISAVALTTVLPMRIFRP